MSKKKEISEPEKPKAIVLIATPSNTGMRNEYSVNAMMSLCWVAGAYGVQIVNGTYDEHPISLARNIACEEFLKSEKITHILFIDSDTVPNPDMLMKLLSHDVPIVSGWYLSRKGSGLPVAFKIEGQIPQRNINVSINYSNFPKWRAYRLDEFLTLPKDKKGLVQVDGVGAGALLIKREALPHLSKPYFLEDSSQKYGFGEDLWFSLNCKIAKIPIYVDLNCFCKHWTWGLIDMRHVQALLQRTKQQQISQIQKQEENRPM
jgi:hypothetical protein